MTDIIQTVLIYVETGGPSLKLADKGIQLSKEINARLCLLHVTDTDIRQTGDEATRIIEENKEKAKKFMGQILHLFSCAALVYIEEGDPVKTIIEKAASVQADLVIISKHSRTMANGKPAGYLAEEVLNDSDLRVVAL